MTLERIDATAHLMKDQQHNNDPEVDVLIDALVKKLQSNREILRKSANYGRLVWRVDRRRGLEIDLEPKI